MEKILLYITVPSVMFAVSTLANIQYHFIYEPKSWSDAQSYCRKVYTDLVTADSAEIMTKLRNSADWNKLGSQTNAWIGLYEDVNSWRWSLSDEAFYQDYGTLYRNWPTGQPDNNGGSGESCLEMTGSGEWNDIGCDQLRKPICSSVSGQTATFTVVNSLMTWTQAQSHCRSHYTDLASVKSSTDNDNIKAIKPAEEAVWLGLFRDQWKWSNGSLLAYTYWMSGEPNGPTESCAATHFDQSGVWVDWECREAKAFICFHEVPSSNHVVKIKLAGSSTVNLQDAAVQEGLLNQFKEKLKMQGVTADIRLGWKRRRDGNVFYQEKQDDQK